MTLADLAKHMEEHTAVSRGYVHGVIKAMVKCIKEQLLAGKNVKIDDLAIFSCGIKNREGANREEDFTTTNNIAGVKFRARATGELRNNNLNLEATIRRASAVVGTTTTAGSGDGTSTGGA
jgi:predicted histone-like DNA-binding protein